MTTHWRIAPNRTLALDRPRILAIVNLTPDSFSDGGALPTTDDALAHMRRCIEEGADVLDLGGESTRPGSASVAPAEQIRRVVPVIEAARLSGIRAPISIDTTRSEVAGAALDAGAEIINDVSAGLDDPAMLALAARRGAGIILMHRLLPPGSDSYSHSYTRAPAYEPAHGGVVGVVRNFLAERASAARRAGIAPEAVVLDPGLGFGKAVEQNFEIIARMHEFAGLGYPILSAASRKSFIGKVTGVDLPAERTAGSVAISVAHALAGIRLFRVHDVRAHAEALRIAARIAP